MSLRVVMAIDRLEPGGAQRQLCLLATSLRNLGFTVEVFVLSRDDFFADCLQDSGAIPVVYLKARNRVHLIAVMRQAIRRRTPDVVIGFLTAPNFFIEMTGLPRRDYAVIASERNLDVSSRGLKRWLRYYLHRFADVVVSNSYAQQERMDQLAPHLKRRTVVIVNGVDTSYFAPRPRLLKRGPGSAHLLVLGRFAPQKNVLRFIEATDLVHDRHREIDLRVDWYGKLPISRGQEDAAWRRGRERRARVYYDHIEDAICRRGMQDWFRLHGPQKDVRDLYARADVVCLPSLYEGCSNVIGEAMACGVPVLASRVSDNVRLVQEGRNGFLFDPLSVEEMAATIVEFAGQSVAERKTMGMEGRQIAEELLSPDVFVDGFVTVITGVLGRQRHSAR